MLNWIKNKLGINTLVEENKKLNNELDKYKNQLNLAKEKVNILEKEFNKLHRIEADISYRDNSFIVLSGKIKGKDYVNIYRVPNDELVKLNSYLKETFRESRIDAPMWFVL